MYRVVASPRQGKRDQKKHDQKKHDQEKYDQKQRGLTVAYDAPFPNGETLRRFQRRDSQNIRRP